MTNGFRIEKYLVNNMKIKSFNLELINLSINTAKGHLCEFKK